MVVTALSRRVLPDKSIGGIRSLCTTPEYYPLRLDFEKRRLTFVRMSRETYRESVFLDLRTRHLDEWLTLRLDDVLLAARESPSTPRQLTCILHPAFCCSTLLARYFELLQSTFVLKEPLLLTQLATTAHKESAQWDEAFELSMRLLTRTYEPNQTVIIKAHEPCNSIGSRLLEGNELAHAICITTPLRHFIVSVLKSSERRNWVRRRVHNIIADGGTGAAGRGTWPSSLSDAQAAAYLWTVNHSLGEELASGGAGKRVFQLNSEQLIESPGQTLRAIVRFCKLPIDEAQIAWITNHPSMQRYSKDLSRPYDATSRRHEIADLENQFGREVDAGVEWATCHSIASAVAQ